MANINEKELLDYTPTSQQALAKWLKEWGQRVCPPNTTEAASTTTSIYHGLMHSTELGHEEAAKNLAFCFSNLHHLADMDALSYQMHRRNVQRVAETQNPVFKIQKFAELASKLGEIITEIGEDNPALSQTRDIISLEKSILQKKIEATRNEEKVEFGIDDYLRIHDLLMSELECIGTELGKNNPVSNLIHSTLSIKERNKFHNELPEIRYEYYELEQNISPNIKQALEGAAKIFPEDDPARKLLQVALNKFPCPAKIKDRQMNLAIPALAEQAITQDVVATK